MYNPRVTILYRLAIVALLSITAASLTACKAESNYFATANSSIGGGDGSSSDGSAGFRIRIKAKTGVAHLLHKFGDLEAGCEIPISAFGTPTEIQCMNNMMEYDLWFYGFEYEFNVPKETCKYATITPNYHYQAAPGWGPVNGTMSTLNGNITACTIDGVAGVIGNGICSGPEGYISNAGSITCAYDYGTIHAGNPGGVTPPNCCMGRGNVVLTSTTTDPTTGNVTVTTSTVPTSYGGSYTKCMQSPHDFLETWPKATSGNASTLIVELGTGALVRNQKIPSTQSLFMAAKRPGSYSNFLNAGFHDWAAYVADSATWDTARTVPRAFAPLVDRGPLDDHLAVNGATAVPTVGDGSEDFRCLGAAGEIKLRIRLYTNEWNTIEDYENYILTGVTAGADPRIAGVAGVDCSAVNVGFSCNTIWGFEDMLIDNGAGLDAYVFPQEFNRGSPP